MILSAPVLASWLSLPLQLSGYGVEKQGAHTMPHRPYKAKSLTGAQRKVRDMQKVLEGYKEVIERFDKERILLAKLAANGPTFYNPVEAFAAEKLRDALLRQEGINPDGSPIRKINDAT